jgi:hypothetical protein
MTLSSSAHASQSMQGALAWLCTTFVLLTGTVHKPYTVYTIHGSHTLLRRLSMFDFIALHNRCQILIGCHLIPLY